MISSNSIILHDNESGQWLCFDEPVEIHAVQDQSSLLDTLKKIEKSVHEDNLYAAGFLSYEAATAINPALPALPPSDFPLSWFGLYRPPRVIDFPESGGADRNLDWQPSISAKQYYKVIERIRTMIRDGETYQVNFSYRLRAAMNADPWGLFVSMVAAQGYGYSAFVELDDWSICSASPELFFAIKNGEVQCRPMKGTVSRGLTLSSDRENRNWLSDSYKDRAENLMIVDMVRNDLGKIASMGTVKADSLFDVEKYPTVWQMTSSIHCRTESGLTDILQALFPAASITGAPKRHTMEIIRDLECSPRNIYTGTIGYYAPDGKAQFNVAIRTMLINKRDKQAEYGVGGGIVWDSIDESEFRETHSKASVLTFHQPEFSLLESMRWEPGEGFWLLQDHMRRLGESAEYFSRPFDANELKQRLDAAVEKLPVEPHKVRVLIDRYGNIDVTTEPAAAKSMPARIALAKQPVDTGNVFLYHKTTHRRAYEEAKAGVDADDVLLRNQNGEITESSSANIVVEMEGHWFTPPVSCGLLGGTYRGHLLREGKVSERVITVDELKKCTRFYLVNSVRGMWEVQLQQ